MDGVPYTDDERAYWHGRHHARPLDLGHGVRASLFTDADSDSPAGLIVSHIHDDGLVCEAGVPFTNGWTVHSLDPVTISPSVLVNPCGLHGFIRQGRWVPA